MKRNRHLRWIDCFEWGIRETIKRNEEEKEEEKQTVTKKKEEIRGRNSWMAQREDKEMKERKMKEKREERETQKNYLKSKLLKK